MKAATSPSSGPARPLRVLHTADVHLDSDSYASGAGRRTHRDLLRRAFRAIVDMSRSEAVDLVLIAGDLFDHNRVGDETVAFVQGELRRAGRPVVVLPGNHDCLNAGAIYDRHDFAAGSGLVRVVSALDGEAVEFPELQVVVWGRGMQDHEPAFHPLDHLPARGSARWHIAMAHGFFHGDGGRVERSSRHRLGLRGARTPSRAHRREPGRCGGLLSRRADRGLVREVDCRPGRAGRAVSGTWGHGRVPDDRPRSLRRAPRLTVGGRSTEAQGATASA
jgi:3',5'-cyclic AMP phosphodiesterase CpdA